MKYVLYAALGLISVIVVIFLVASFQPQDWRIEKTVLIKAPKERVWTIVSDWHRFNEWNPYYHMEPESKTQANGPAATVGSSYSWDGEKSGAGKMTATLVNPNERIEYRLDFYRPMAVVNQGSFIVSGTDGEEMTRMSWAMSGRHEGLTGLISRSVYLFVSMDAMLGKMFEDGLNRLRAICEKAA